MDGGDVVRLVTELDGKAPLKGTTVPFLA